MTNSKRFDTEIFDANDTSNKARDAGLETIAEDDLNIETLLVRNSDQLDIHEVSVGMVLTALRNAYFQGFQEATEIANYDHSHSA